MISNIHSSYKMVVKNFGNVFKTHTYNVYQTSGVDHMEW